MSLELANTAKREAARTRSEWIVSLNVEGPDGQMLVSIPDLLRQATTEEGRPLRRISLRQLLLTQEGWGRARADRVLSLTTSLLGHEPTSRLTVAWLIDARAGRRRVHALADALTERVAPWIGFPYAPPLPAGGGN